MENGNHLRGPHVDDVSTLDIHKPKDLIFKGFGVLNAGTPRPQFGGTSDVEGCNPSKRLTVHQGPI